MGDHETVLHVRGMTCGHCVDHVTRALRQVPGVIDVKVDLAAGTARVTHAPVAEVARMAAAIADAGYETSAPA